jgi:hypothetical protein
VNIQIKPLEGRAHYVVPMVMIVEGVLNGSSGPLFYPKDEIARSAPMWNGRPVVAYHPRLAHSSYAGSPEVFNAQKIGIVFNARMDGRRLLADAWLDLDRLAQVDARILHAIKNRRMMEVSTGLIVDFDETSGATFNAIARNFRPDHLAVLPDQIGACSIADGAGLIRNEVNLIEALEQPTW